MLDFLWMQVVKQSKKPNKQNLPESLQSDSPLAPAPCPFLCSKCQLVRFTVWKECAGLCEDRPVGGGGVCGFHKTVDAFHSHTDQWGTFI